MARLPIHLYALMILSIALNTINAQVDNSATAQVSFVESCDLNLENGLCLYDGNVVMAPPPSIDGLIMFLTFDQSDVIDQSGSNNNADGVSSRGPGFLMNRGYSAHYQGDFRSRVAPSDSINNAFNNQFSLSFWIFTNSLGTLTTEQCPIIEKGDTNGYAFAFLINVASRQFMVATATVDGQTTLTSNGRLQNQRWTHVAVTRSNNMMTLYINGNLDAVVQTSEGGPTRSRTLYIGRMPWQDAQGGGCNLDFFIDELKVWNIVIDESWIEAESGIALGAGIDPHSIELG